MLQHTQITKLISSLLYKHDCVIVPNFGGFVAQSYSAHFTKGNTLLLPPTKHVLFNKNLKHNDGLLTSSLSELCSINYAESAKQIEDYKEYIEALLNIKKRFELTNLGLLYINTDNEIRFEPKVDVNILIDSFGFDAIIANEIEQHIETRVLKPIFEDKKIVTERKNSRTYSVKQMALLAVGLPITMALLVFAANSKPMQPIMQSSLNPFHSHSKTYNSLNYKTANAFYLDKINNTSIIVDSRGNAAFKLSKTGTVLMASDNVVTENLKPISIVNLKASYQVVVGCFGVRANANRLIKELKVKHISAQINGVNAKGLFVVSCGGFDLKNEANNFANTLKNDFPNTWVMTK